MRLIPTLCLALVSLPAVAQPEIQPAGQIVLRVVPVENINGAASPCTDFDAYANGQWRATHPMPPIQTVWAIRSITQDDTRARLRSIAEEDAAKSSTLAAGSPGQLTGDFYAACMDQPRIDSLALKPLEPMLKAMGAVHDPASLSSQIVALQQIEVEVPLVLAAQQDIHDTTHMIADVSPALHAQNLRALRFLRRGRNRRRRRRDEDRDRFGAGTP